jgi:DNA-binding beta-propeller fold protein YncE
MHSRILASAQAVAVKIIGSPYFASAGIVMLAAGLAYLASYVEPPSAQAAVQQPKLMDAPELVGGTDWFNTEKPIRLADLRGRIVLLDFWTLCCINCIHTLPDLATIEARYPGVVVVIGIHTPKFDNEKKSASVLKAILRYEIKHPVINDADKKIAMAYNWDHWPTLVLIDPEGKIRAVGKGEGHLDGADTLIKGLIKEYEAKGMLKKTPLPFKLTSEKATSGLSFPGKVLADAGSKRIFIADSTNHRIVITDLDGKKIAIAGSGKEGFKDGAFADAQFSDPQGLALDGETLYVADRKNHMIRALNLKDETVKVVAGNGTKKMYGQGANFGPARKVAIASPWDVLMHNKRLYIAMAGTNQLWSYDPVKDTVGVYAGDANEDIRDGPVKTARFAQPSGLATNGKRLYCADSETSSIRSVPLFGAPGNVETIVGQGLFAFGDRNGIGEFVRLQHALGVAYHDGKLYVADTYNSKIKIIDPAKHSCATFYEGPNKLNEPGGLSIAGGKMYVADTNNHRIQIIDMQTREASMLQLQGVDPVRRSEMESTLEKKCIRALLVPKSSHGWNTD